MGKAVKINNIKAQWDPSSSKCWEQSGEWEGNLEGRNVVIREGLRNGDRDICKVGKSMCRWLRSEVVSGSVLLLLFVRRWISQKCQWNVSLTSMYLSSALWLSKELPSCSNVSFNCFPLAIKVRGHKILNQMTGKFGTLLNLTPSSSFIFWKIYSYFYPKLHSSKQAFSVSQSISVSKQSLNLNSSKWKKSPDLRGALWRFIHSIIWDRKRVCIFIWCRPFQNSMTRI